MTKNEGQAPSPGPTPAPPTRRPTSQGFPVHGPCLRAGIRRTRHEPRIRMDASTSGGAEPQQVRRWRPLRELGKVCFNERCAARSKGRFRASGDSGPVSPGGTTDNTPKVGKHPAPSGALRLEVFLASDDGMGGRETPRTIRCIETLTKG